MFISVSEELTSQRSLQTILICVSSLVLCQLFKFVIMSLKYKKVLLNALFTTGGMPSSHTATVTTLVGVIGIFQYHDNGFFDYGFAVALAISCVVIHDAMGVRFEASKHAKILNKMVEDQDDDVKQSLGYGKRFKLKELVGHKPLEVFFGWIFGAIVAIVGALIFINIK